MIEPDLLMPIHCNMSIVSISTVSSTLWRCCDEKMLRLTRSSAGEQCCAGRCLVTIVTDGPPTMATVALERL